MPADGEILDTTKRPKNSSRRLRRPRVVTAVVAILAFSGGLAAVLTHDAGRPRAATSPHGLRPGTSPVAQPGVHHDVTRPPLGASGYPREVYPAPIKGKAAVQLCPRPTHLQPPGPAARHRAVTIAEHFQSAPYHRALHSADRAIWSQLYTAAQQRKYHVRFHREPVLSSGPLDGRYTGGGAPSPAGWISHDCPPAVGQSSYEVAIGPRDGPALDGVFVFVQRAGRMLLYFVYP